MSKTYISDQSRGKLSRALFAGGSGLVGLKGSNGPRCASVHRGDSNTRSRRILGIENLNRAWPNVLSTNREGHRNRKVFVARERDCRFRTWRRATTERAPGHGIAERVNVVVDCIVVSNGSSSGRVSSARKVQEPVAKNGSEEEEGHHHRRHHCSVYVRVYRSLM